ncbi:RsiV family protein [Paenibacillus tundrae]
MKFRWVYVLILALITTIIVPTADASAAGTIAVKSKVLYYKGQPYIELSGGNKSVTAKLNKMFKVHAVHIVSADKKIKKENKKYSVSTTSATVKFNQKEKISVVYEDYIYAGAAHGFPSSTSYNYDLRTGKELKFKDFVQNDEQLANLEESISSSLRAMYNANQGIFEENINDFPLDQDPAFYIYDKGIVIRFYPYEVAPYAAGFVDVKVPYSKIKK